MSGAERSVPTRLTHSFIIFFGDKYRRRETGWEEYVRKGKDRGIILRSLIIISSSLVYYCCWLLIIIIITYDCYPSCSYLTITLPLLLPRKKGSDNSQTLVFRPSSVLGKPRECVCVYNQLFGKVM